MKHNWIREKNGNIDEWAFEYGFHNGVVCKNCGRGVCIHCVPNWEDLDDCNAKDDYNDGEDKLRSLRKAKETICSYCESNECEQCQVTRIIDDFETEVSSNDA